MHDDPGDLRFQKGNALIQLVQRIAIEVLAGEAAGGIAAQLRSIVVVH